MKYSISNWIYGEEPFEKSLQRLARFKYDGVEIKGEPEVYDMRTVREFLERYDLEASSVCGMYSWPTEERDLSNPDEKVRKRAVDYVKNLVDFAHGLGAPLIVVCPFCVAKTKPLAPLEDEWKWAVNSVKEAGTYAMERDVLLAIEPINRYETYLVNNANQALEFMRDVGLDSVKIMLDCFHMNIEEPDPAASIRRAGNNLIHVHVADSNRQSIGRGHTDFKSIVRSLKEIGYERYLAMEPLPPLADPLAARKGIPPSEFLDLYAEECITQARFIEKVV